MPLLEALFWFSLPTALFVAGCALAHRFVNRRNRAWAQRRIAEHQKTFGPGACPVCSFHRFGLMHGYENHGSRPQEHDCPEAPREEAPDAD